MVCGNRWPWNGIITTITTAAAAAANSYGRNQVPGLPGTAASVFHMLTPLILLASYEVGTIFRPILWIKPRNTAVKCYTASKL